MSQWLKNPQLAAQAEALKGNINKAAATTTKMVSSQVGAAKEVISTQVYGEAGPHRVSDYAWRSKMFNFRATIHHGVPGRPKVLAFDPVQRMLAIGTGQGLVKVFGKPGVEVVVNQYPSAITHLAFVANEGKLVIVHGGGNVDSVNLGSKRPIGGYTLKQDTVSMLEPLPLSPFVLVGTAGGNVNVFNAANGSMSMYAVSCRTNLDLRKPGKVTGLAVCPIDPQTILIGHECGNLLEWNLTRQQVAHRYTLGGKLFMEQLGSLQAAVWDPSGQKVLAGFRNGDLILWKKGPESESVPHKRVQMSYHPGTPRRPIKQLFWTKVAGKGVIATLGGTSVSHEQDTVMIRYQKKLTELPARSMSLSKNDPNAGATEVVQCQLICKSEFPGSMSPVAMLGVTAAASLSAYATTPDGVFPSLAAPPTAQLQHSKITCTQFCNVSMKFLSDLNKAGDIRWRANGWPVLGGSAALQPQMSTDVLVTGHADGAILIWDMSSVQLQLVYGLNVAKAANVAPADVAVQTLDLCPDSRILACSLARGETFVFQFNDTPVTITEVVTVRKPAPAAAGAPPAINRAAKPPAMDTLDIAATEDMGGSKRRSSKTPRASKEATGPPVWSWKKFFLNAGIEKEAATTYAKSFDDQKMTEDLIKELDKDLLEMAGVTPVGDKMRIWKYIKNDYQRELCLKAPRASKSRKGKSSSSSKSSSSRKKKKEVSVSSSQMAELAASPRVPVAQPAAPAMIEEKQEVTRMVPGGYQVKIQCSFMNPITQLRIASSLHKVAVGDKRGNVALVDISSGTVLLHKALGSKTPSPVGWLCFDDSALVKKKKKAVLESGLFVGLEDGRIFYIALKTGQVDMVPIVSYVEDQSILSHVMMLDGTGSAVSPDAEQWKSSEEREQEEREREEELRAQTEELVIRNLDEERAARKEEAVQKPTSIADQKYLLVCAADKISIYSLPSYALYSSYTCAHPPVSANVLERDGNHCLAVFLSSGDVQVLTLMDLLEVKTMPNALQKVGVAYNKRNLKNDVNCAPDGRFVVISKYQEVVRGSLFADENLLGLPYSLPSLHVPNVPWPDVDMPLFELSRGPQRLNHKELFGRYHPKREAPKPVRASPREARPGVSHGQPSGHPSSGHSGHSSGGSSKGGTAKGHASLQTMGGKVLKGVSTSVGGSIAEVKDIMNKNFEGLAIRQEKLDELLESTARLENRSSGFADIAEQMANKEKNKKWWK